jgi:HEAT repeat protein
MRRAQAIAYNPGKTEQGKPYDHDTQLARDGGKTVVRLNDELVLEAHIQNLTDRSQHVRQQAAQHLGRLKDTRAAAPLIEALLNDESFYVRSSAAYALGILGDVRAAQPLIHALDDESECVRQGAIEALGVLGYRSIIEPLVKAVLDDDSLVVRQRANEVVEALTDALRTLRQHAA